MDLFAVMLVFHGMVYLAGSVLTHFPDTEAAARAADFFVTRDRVESDALLTPGNEQVFLYDSAGMDDLVELYRTTYQRVVSREPAARSHFDVYLRDRTLFHVREPCVREDARYRVFANVFPEDRRTCPDGTAATPGSPLGRIPRLESRDTGEPVAPAVNPPVLHRIWREPADIVDPRGSCR